AETEIKGGLTRQVRVILDAPRLAGYGLSPLKVADALQKGNANLSSGAFSSNNRELLVDTGGFLESNEAVKRLVVGTHDNKPVYLADVAQVLDGVREPEDFVFFGLGASDRSD